MYICVINDVLSIYIYITYIYIYILYIVVMHQGHLQSNNPWPMAESHQPQESQDLSVKVPMSVSILSARFTMLSKHLPPFHNSTSVFHL